MAKSAPAFATLCADAASSLGHRLPVVRANVGHVFGHRHRVHGYLRVIMLTHDGRRLQTNRAVTQGGALGAAGYDANVFGQYLRLRAQKTKRWDGRPFVAWPSSVLIDLQVEEGGRAKRRPRSRFTVSITSLQEWPFRSLTLPAASCNN